MEGEKDLPSSSNIQSPSTPDVNPNPPATTNEATPVAITTHLRDAVRSGRFVEVSEMSPTGIVGENNQFKKMVRLPLENVSHNQADSTSDSTASLQEVLYENQVSDFKVRQATTSGSGKQPPPPPPPTPSD